MRYVLKSFFTILNAVLIFASITTAQEIHLISQSAVIGKHISFSISNFPSSVKLLNPKNMKINFNNVNYQPDNCSIIKLDSTTLIVNFDIPNLKSFIGADYFYLTDNNDSALCGQLEFYAGGSIPVLDKYTNNIVNISNTTQTITLSGNNLTSLSALSVSNDSPVEIESYEVSGDNNLTLHIKAVKETNTVSFKMTYKKFTGINTPPADTTVDELVYLNVNSLGIAGYDLPPVLMNDIVSRNYKVSFTFKFGRKLTRQDVEGLSISSDNFLNESYKDFAGQINLASYKPADSLTLTLRVAESVTPGTKQILLSYVGHDPVANYVEILQPQIIGLSSSEQPSLKFNPFAKNQTITVYGKDINQNVTLTNTNLSGYLSLVPESNGSANLQVYKLVFNPDMPKSLYGSSSYLKIGNDYSTVFNTPIYISEPRVPMNLNLIMHDNSYEKLSLKDALDYCLLINKNKIPGNLGRQQIILTASLYDDGDNLVSQVSKTFDFYKDELKSDTLFSVRNEFNSSIKAWDKIVIELKHAPDFYQSDRLQDFTKKIKIEGSFWSHLTAAACIPPILYIKQIDHSASNIISFSAGGGVIYNFRDADDNLEPYNLGFYITTLNIFAGQNSSGGSTQNNNVFSGGDVAFMLLGGLNLLTPTKITMLPVNVGVGLRLNDHKSSAMFWTISLGMNIQI